MILTAQFYRELKNVIKNEIICTNKLKMFFAIIIKTIILNNQQYERRLEKKNRVTYISVKKSKKNKRNKSYYDFQSMKLNIMHKISINACKANTSTYLF